MRGGVKQILRKRAFDYASLVAGSSETTVLGDIDSSEFGDAMLGVRVHANATTGTSTMLVELFSKAYSPDDPATDFVAAEPAASVTLDESTEAGTLLVCGLLPGFGGCLELRITGTRVGSDTLSAELSAELVARRGVAAPRRSLADTLVVGNATSGTDLVVSSGDALRPAADDAVDVGTSGTRFRTIHAGTSVEINNQPAARVVQTMQTSTLRI